MVDKSPWNADVIQRACLCLSFIFFTEVWKSTAILLKSRSYSLLATEYNVKNQAKLHIVGRVGGEAKQVKLFFLATVVWRVCKSAKSANLSQDFCLWLQVKTKFTESSSFYWGVWWRVYSGSTFTAMWSILVPGNWWMADWLYWFTHTLNASARTLDMVTATLRATPSTCRVNYITNNCPLHHVAYRAATSSLHLNLSLALCSVSLITLSRILL